METATGRNRGFADALLFKAGHPQVAFFPDGKRLAILCGRYLALAEADGVIYWTQGVPDEPAAPLMGLAVVDNGRKLVFPGRKAPLVFVELPTK
jgi:hypothetical protein